MKIHLPLIVKDPVTSRFQDISDREGYVIETEERFLDGPVCRRVAVLDFDPATGALTDPAPFELPAPGRKTGRYRLKEDIDVHDPEFIKVSVFAAVLKTIEMFEEPDVLGRQVEWAFRAPQLLVVPRAGEWENAFYERESHSLQFFFFSSAGEPSEIIYTALSRDIVTHETAHAILDAIAPDLYHAISPQSLALHEAVADLAALFAAFRSSTLRVAVLKEYGGRIDNTQAFSGLAEQFAEARDPSGRNLYLRNLNNDRRLPGPGENPLTEPHALSEVLTGALYHVMQQVYAAVWAEQQAAHPDKSALETSGYALFVAGERLKRMVFRALDYLPPGEISFADYGRAIIAADQAAHPHDPQERGWIADEFVNRGIVAAKEELNVPTKYPSEPLKDVVLETLRDSDWAAYEFARANRPLLRIPDEVPFRVRPRADVRKTYFHRPGAGTVDAQQEVRECLFKVSWDVNEPSNIAGLPARRHVTAGTTLAIDWQTKQIRSILTTDTDGRQASDREELLRHLTETGQLLLGEEALGPDDRPRPSVICGEVMNDVLRVRGMARMLHLTGEAP